MGWYLYLAPLMETAGGVQGKSDGLFCSTLVQYDAVPVKLMCSAMETKVKIFSEVPLLLTG